MNSYDALSILGISDISGLTVKDIKVARRKKIKEVHPDKMGDEFNNMSANVNMACDMLIKELENGTLAVINKESTVARTVKTEFTNYRTDYSVNNHISVEEYVKECKKGNYSKYTKDTWSIVFDIHVENNGVYRKSLLVRKDDTYSCTIPLDYEIGDSLKIRIGDVEQDVKLNGTCCRVVFNFNYILKLVMTIEKM